MNEKTKQVLLQEIDNMVEAINQEEFQPKKYQEMKVILDQQHEQALQELQQKYDAEKERIAKLITEAKDKFAVTQQERIKNLQEAKENIFGIDEEDEEEDVEEFGTGKYDWKKIKCLMAQDNMLNHTKRFI